MPKSPPPEDKNFDMSSNASTMNEDLSGYDKTQIPLLDKKLLPDDITIPIEIWHRIYILLSEAPRGMLKPQDLSQEYSRRFKKALGGKDFFAKCRVRSLAGLICALPDVEPIKSNGVWHYHLRDRNSTAPRMNYMDRIQRIETKPKLNARNSYSDSDSDYDEEEESRIIGDLPDQPLELLPAGARIPNEMRRKLYKMLITNDRYRKGITIKDVRDAYSKMYGQQIANNKDCNLSEDQLFYAMRDCMEAKRDDTPLQNLWIKPRPIEEVLRIHKERPTEIFQMQPPPPKENSKAKWLAMRDRERRGLSRIELPTTSGATSAFQAPGPSGYVGPKIQPRNEDFEEENWDNVVSSSTASINKTALTHMIASNSRSNLARESERLQGAQENLAMLAVNDEIEDVAIALNRRMPPFDICLGSPNDELQLLFEALITIYDEEWVDNKRLWALFAETYGRVMSFEEPALLKNAMVKRPDLFAFDNKFFVKPRKYITGMFVDQKQVQNTLSVVDFGIAENDVFTGSLEELRLEVGEEVEVTISYVNTYGEFYLQMASLSNELSDLEYDMNICYSTPTEMERYAITQDEIKVGFPVAVLFKPNWRRCIIRDVDKRYGAAYIYVRDVDSGNDEWVTDSRVCLLKREFIENRVPPAAMYASLAYLQRDPELFNSNAKSVLDEYLEFSGSIWIKVIGVTPQESTPEVHLMAEDKDGTHHDVNEKMVKKGYAEYLTGAQESRENDNDLTLSGGESGRTSGSRWTHAALNRFSSTDTDSSTSTTSDNVESFNKYGAEAMLRAIKSHKPENNFHDEQPANVFRPIGGASAVSNNHVNAQSLLLNHLPVAVSALPSGQTQGYLPFNSTVPSVSVLSHNNVLLNTTSSEDSMSGSSSVRPKTTKSRVERILKNGKLPKKEKIQVKDDPLTEIEQILAKKFDDPNVASEEKEGIYNILYAIQSEKRNANRHN